MTVQVRFDKNGKRLPDTGHGCGCSLCESAGAPRYERRSLDAAARREGDGGGGEWSGLRRMLFRKMRGLRPSRTQAT